MSRVAACISDIGGYLLPINSPQLEPLDAIEDAQFKKQFKAMK